MANSIAEELKPIIQHHEHIWGRFVVDWENYDGGIVTELLDQMRIISGRNPWIDSVEIDLNGESPILSIWINFEAVPLSGRMLEVIQFVCLNDFGLQSSTWFNRETGGTRLSVWSQLPDDLADTLKIWDEQWTGRKLAEQYISETMKRDQ